jgi:hypothetical protein
VYKIKVDITKMRNVLHNEWDGEQPKTFKTFVKQNKQRMTDSILKSIPSELVESVNIDFTSFNATIQLNENATRQNAFTSCDELTQRDLIAYVW